MCAVTVCNLSVVRAADGEVFTHEQLIEVDVRLLQAASSCALNEKRKKKRAIKKGETSIDEIKAAVLRQAKTINLVNRKLG